MTQILNIEAEKRIGTGKGIARELRREGKVPAVIYGKDVTPMSISLCSRSFTKEYNKGGMFAKICEITVDGKKIKALPREMQFHPVNDAIQHVDFVFLHEDQKIRVTTRVVLLNEEKCVGIKRGGVLNIAAREIEVFCLPKDIPETVELDLSELHIGESLHIHNINFPAGVEPSGKGDLAIVTVVGRMAEEKATDATVNAAGEEIAIVEEMAEGEEDEGEEDASSKEGSEEDKK
jgi:large subunit ribosomal protein L25